MTFDFDETAFEVFQKCKEHRCTECPGIAYVEYGVATLIPSPNAVVIYCQCEHHRRTA